MGGRNARADPRSPIRVLRRYLKECAGAATRVRPIAGVDSGGLARALTLPLPRDSDVRRDAVQDALEEVHRRSQEGRKADVYQLLELDDVALLRAFGLRVRRRLIDAAPNRGTMQALRLHVKALLEDPGALPRASAFQPTLVDGDRFSRKLVAAATAVALKEIEAESQALLKKGWERDAGARRTVTRKVMRILRETYLTPPGGGQDVNDDPGRGRKRSAMAPRAALRLLRDMATEAGEESAAVFILQAADKGYPEIRKELGIPLSTAHRSLAKSEKVLRRAVMREKGRLRHRGIDVADAERVVPGESEWAEVVGEIGKVANARGPLRDAQREELRCLVSAILASAKRDRNSRR